MKKILSFLFPLPSIITLVFLGIILLAAGTTEGPMTFNYWIIYMAIIFVFIVIPVDVVLYLSNKGKEPKEKKFNPKSILIGIAIIGLAIFYVVSPKKDESSNSITSNSEEYAEQKESKQELALSGIELFSGKMSDSSEYVSYETSEKLYNFLHEDLLFSDIEFLQKSAAGNILFDVNADGYNLMISVDNDGIYSVRCGSYDLYDGSNILITKTGLDDRNIGDNESKYYSIAQEIVKNNLKSPNSANFPSLWSEEVKMQRYKDMVIVQSYVDAQNSFGATIRSEWQVEFKVIDLESYSYEIIYINIDGTSVGEFVELQ